MACLRQITKPETCQKSDPGDCAREREAGVARALQVP
jgi:hypothetical protein